MEFDPALLPKVELHLHLDCSLSYGVVSRLDPSTTQQEYDWDFVAPPRCPNLADFLTRAPRGFNLMQTESALRLVTEDVIEQLRRDQVIYAEIRFAPLLHTEKGLRPEAVVEIVEDAAAKASESTGVEVWLILCTLRHYTEAQSLETARLVERFQGTRVAALDIAGDEAGFPIDAHVAAFQYALDRQLPHTAHAGEASGPQSVWETLEQFQPSRLGHGVRSIEDAELVDHLRQHDVHLEVCPTSNLQTNMYETYADHPIDRLYAAGVSVGINTDARAITPTTLTKEYEHLRRAFGWGKDRFLQCNVNAVRAAFCPDSVKQQLERQLREAYAKI